MHGSVVADETFPETASFIPSACVQPHRKFTWHIKMQMITSKLNLKIVYDLSDNRNNNHEVSFSAALYFNVILTKLTFFWFACASMRVLFGFAYQINTNIWVLYANATCLRKTKERVSETAEHVKFVNLESVCLFAQIEVCWDFQDIYFIDCLLELDNFFFARRT